MIEKSCMQDVQFFQNKIRKLRIPINKKLAHTHNFILKIGRLAFKDSQSYFSFFLFFTQNTTTTTTQQQLN